MGASNAREWKIGGTLLGIFLVAYFLPIGRVEVADAFVAAFELLQWYARNHTLACVVPAIFIAGAITTFLSQSAVMRYLGPRAKKLAAYSVASVSGTVLAVCSCSVLPMFAGIYRLGAGIGPASAFLYAGPAINVLAIFLTARVLGFELGVARALGAILFAFLIGLSMAFLFRREEAEREEAAMALPPPPPSPRPGWKSALFLVAMVAFLVFSDWFNPGDVEIEVKDGRTVSGVVVQETADKWTVQLQASDDVWTVERAGRERRARTGDSIEILKDDVVRLDKARSWVTDIHGIRWWLAGLCGLFLLLMAWRWFERDELGEWMGNTWDFAKLIVPWLFAGVFVVGFLADLLPAKTVGQLVGDDSFLSILTGSVVGALFYFATLTEVPIVQALTENGMAQGPALALLLAGPALSLPNILVIWKIMGGRKTLAFCLLVVVMATGAGVIYSWVI